MRVKVCGICRFEDAAVAVAAGANAIGCLVGLDYDVPDQIDASAARAIFASLPPFVARVLVTHKTSEDEVVALARQTSANTIQLHGAFPLGRIAALRAALPCVAVVKAVHVVGEEAIENARWAAHAADAVLLDTRTSSLIGGTGAVHDWSISARIVAACSKPVILAGGLTPENVTEAIARVSPFAVDVNSGTKGPDGLKSHGRIRAFLGAAMIPQGIR